MKRFTAVFFGMKANLMGARLLLPLFCSGVLFSACEQIIEIELPAHTPQLVVNGTFSPDSVINVQVSASKHLQDTANLRSVDNARLVVYENGVVWDSLDFVPGAGFEGPYYRGTRYPVAGLSYRIEASAPGFTDVEGEDRIPMPVPLQGVTRRDSVAGSNPDNPYTELSVTFDDPVGEGDAYVLGAFFRDSIETNPGVFTFFNYALQVESADPNLQYDFYSGTFSLSDKTFDGRRVTIKVRVVTWDLENGDTYVVLGKVSDHYYRYQRTFNEYQETAFNPFAEPVIVHSNMTPHMGIFAGYSVSRILIPQ